MPNLLLKVVWAGIAVLALAAVSFALLAPVVSCGGLLLTVPETLLPQIAIAVAYPIALGGLLVGLVWTRRSAG